VDSPNRSCLKLETGTSQKVFEILNQSVPVLLGIFIFLNPFPHTTAIKEICFYLSVLIVCLLVSVKKLEWSFKSPFARSVGLFVFWAFLGIFFAINKENSIHDFYSHLIRYIILYYILIHFFSSKKRLVSLSWVIIISGTIFSIGGLFYFYLILGNSLLSRLWSLSQRPVNVVGVISGISILFALNQLYFEKHIYRRAALICCFFPLAGIIIAGQTRSVLVGIFLATILLLGHKKKNIVIIIGIFSAIVAISPYKGRFILNRSVLNDDRISIMNNMNYISYEMIKEHPIIGIGFGLETYRELDLEKYNKRLPEKIQRQQLIADPHNMILDVGVRAGVVGLAFFLGILFVFFRMCWLFAICGKDDFIKNWGRCLAGAFVVILTIGLFQPIFSHVPEVLLCIIFSGITVLWRLNNNVAQNTHQHSLD